MLNLSIISKLEHLSYQFETREFRSRKSLAYVKSEDLDAFFPSPDKLLLEERRLLKAELEKIRKGTVPRSNFRLPTVSGNDNRLVLMIMAHGWQTRAQVNIQLQH